MHYNELLTLTPRAASLIVSIYCLDDVALYTKAITLLSTIPQFTFSNHSLNSKTVISIPMDYDPEWESMVVSYKEQNLTDVHREAYSLLEESSALGNVDASYTLADINMYGNWSFPQNASNALRYYHAVVEAESNATAYYNLGFMYATGLFGQVEQNQAKANLFYKFAYENGDMRAAMALGYRYINGVGLSVDWDQALFYYQQVANSLKQWYDSGPIGGPDVDSYNIRIADWNDGIYGKGVGDIPSSLTRRSDRFDDIIDNNNMNDVATEVDFFYYKAINAYEGSYTRKRNFEEAAKYCKLCVEEGLPLTDILSIPEQFYTSRCLYLLGKMNMRGEGMAVNHTEAIRLMEMTSKVYELSMSYAALGLIYEQGTPDVRNITMAHEYFEIFAKKGSTNKYEYGRFKWFHGTEDEKKNAAKIIESSALHGHYPAMYLFSDLTYETKQKKDAPHVASALKYYSEHFDPLLTSLEWAFFELLEGRTSNALIGYAMAAEQGFEQAQASAAYLLYSPPSMLESPPITTKERKEMALAYIKRSSTQHNTDSAVWLGDMYFNIGEYDNAMACYETVSKRSSQATFNMGWLYEMGLGVDKDFHLAKRYYDLALSIDAKAYLPAQMALLKLRIKSIIGNLWGSTTLPSAENEASNKRTWSDWKNLYYKVRGSGDTQEEEGAPIVDEIDDNGEFVIQDDNGFFDNFDWESFLVPAIALVIFTTLFWFQQRQLMQQARRGQRAQGNNQDGEGQNRGLQVQVQFGFVAI